MRYFKVVVTYILTEGEGSEAKKEQVLYCCSPTTFPKHEELSELFYSLDSPGRQYQDATWKEVREEEIPTDEIHLL